MSTNEHEVGSAGAKGREISDAVGEILSRVDADVAARRPVCQASGRCCKFEEYGHRLYVTGAEMVHFALHHMNTPNEAGAPSPALRPPPARALSLTQYFEQSTPKGCPYQIKGLCTAREARPLGCRIYFCDENAQEWQNDIYEKYHAEFRALHERLGLPYQYVEWRAALKELGAKD